MADFRGRIVFEGDAARVERLVAGLDRSFDRLNRKAQAIQFGKNLEKAVEQSQRLLPAATLNRAERFDKVVNSFYRKILQLGSAFTNAFAPVVLASGAFDKVLGNLNEQLVVARNLNVLFRRTTDSVGSLDRRLEGINRVWRKTTYDFERFNTLAAKQLELEDRRTQQLNLQANAMRRQLAIQGRLFADQRQRRNIRASRNSRRGSGFLEFSQNAAARAAAAPAIARAQASGRILPEARGPFTDIRSVEAAGKRQKYYDDLSVKASRDKKRIDTENDRTRQKASRTILRMERRLNKAANDRLKAQRNAERERSRNRENLLLGLGFPLLFGGGPGSVLGGVAGAVAGNRLGQGGFGLQIVGSAVGQQLDQLGQFAGELGQALIKPTTNLERLVETLGIANTGLESTINTLRDLGFESVASGVAVAEFESKYGEATVDSLRMVGEEFTNMQNALTSLGVRIAALLAGPFGALFRTIGAAAGSAANAEAARQLNNNLSGEQRANFRRDLNELTGGAGFSGFISDQSLQTLIQRYDPATIEAQTRATKERQAAEKLIADDIQRQVDLAKGAVSVEENRLTTARDLQARFQGNLTVQRASNELAKAQANYAAETEASKKRLLALEVNLAKAAEDQAKAARENAVIEAQRQITRDVSSNLQAEAQAAISVLGVRQQIFDLANSQADSYAQQLETDQEIYEINRLILDEQRKISLLGVVEDNVRKAINLRYDMQLQLLKDQNEALAEQRRQSEVLRMDKERELALQRQINDLQARQSAAQQIRETDPQRRVDASTAGLGFFGESELFAQNRLEQSAAQLELYNEQIGALQSRIDDLNSKGVDPDRILPLRQTLTDLEQTRDLFQQLQPGIDAAAISARRYADALRLVSPGINSLTQGLQAWVRGTQTAQEVFVNFLNTIADQLVSTAATMIAQYIAIGIARAFATGAASSSGSGFSSSGYYDPQTGLGTAGPNFNLADGGMASRGSSYLVGERGPELFIPGQTGTVVPNDIFNATRAALAGQSTNTADAFSDNSQALAVANSYTREREIERDRQTVLGAAGSLTIETQVINNVEYATVEQVEQASMQSARRARAQVFSDMRNKPSTRSSLGLGR